MIFELRIGYSIINSAVKHKLLLVTTFSDVVESYEEKRIPLLENSCLSASNKVLREAALSPMLSASQT